MSGLTHGGRPPARHVKVEDSCIDPYGNEKVGLEITGALSRGDYGMTFNQALGSGNMLVGDKVKLALDISAAKQSLASAIISRRIGTRTARRDSWGTTTGRSRW
ncbi:MAG TPA: hypothetical protein VNZ62_04240 [Capillimicrobium sp.]|nr:hypothetical protein [Capillimicrobium sp.]